MKKVFQILLLILMAPELLVNDAWAQKATGLLSGDVVDEAGVPVPGVVLRLNKHNRYTITDENGHYVFLNVPAESYKITSSSMGFQDYEATVTVVADKNNKHNVVLRDKTYMTGELVVVGELLRGLARALNLERSNSNITNLVASDQIGKFPDSNMGDALKRITGITMQNDQGEARNIVMRGLAPELNSVTINGSRIPSAEGDNRNVQLDLIPSDMVSLIEVNKTLLPDMEADAIGGSVNLITNAAPKKRRLSFDLGGGYNPIRNTPTYKGSFTYGDRFFDKKLGAVLSLSYKNKDYGSDNIEGEWAKDKKGNVYMSDMQVRKYDVQRVRKSVSLNLDYQINDKNNIRLNTMYNHRDDRENRFRLRYNKIKPLYGEDGAITGYEGNITRQTKGGIDNNRNKNRRLEDQRVASVALLGEHLIGSTLDLDWGLSYAQASEDRPNERYIDFQQKKITIHQDLSDPTFPLFSTNDEKEDKMKLKELTENHNYTREKDFTGYLNFRSPFSVIKDRKGRLRYGAKVRIKDKLRDDIKYEYEPTDGSFATFKDIDHYVYDGKNFIGKDKYVPGAFADAKALGKIDLLNTGLFKQSEMYEEFWPINYTAKENVYAGYLRWDQDINDKLLLITGLRVEYTNIDYTGNTLNGEEKYGEPVEGNNNYVNFFPNLTMRYKFSDQTILRGAFSTSLARPNYYWLVPYTMIVANDKNIEAGNPKLDATYSYNFDLIGTHYFGNVGQVSLGAFYKRLDKFIYQFATNSYTQSDFNRDFPQFQALSQEIFEPNDVWEYKQRRNGSNVDLYGFEVAFQRSMDFIPGKFFRRLNVYLNYSYTHSQARGIETKDGEERTDMRLPGSAPHTANASLSYEDKIFTCRLSYNFTSSYLDALGKDDFEDVYYGAQSFLDFNASVKLHKGLRIYLEANNLTNQPLHYYQGQKDRLYQLEYYRPTVSAGIKWNL